MWHTFAWKPKHDDFYAPIILWSRGVGHLSEDIAGQDILEPKHTMSPSDLITMCSTSHHKYTRDLLSFALVTLSILIGFMRQICPYLSGLLHGHYDDVIMTTIASQTTSLTVVYSIVYSGVDQRKHQSSASLAFVRGIHRRPVNSPHKGPVTRKIFPFDDVIMPQTNEATLKDMDKSTVTKLQQNSAKRKACEITL